MRIADCRNLSSLAYLIAMVVLTGLLSGCSQLMQLTTCCDEQKVTIEVPIPPKIGIDKNIAEFKLHPIAGTPICASSLQTGIDAKVKNAGVWLTPIDGIPDLEGPLEIAGKVENCDIRMGHGNITGELALSHNGKPLYQMVIRQETNRPGASAEEVRGVLTDRVVDEFVKIFVWTKVKKLRQIVRIGNDDAAVNAAKSGNWNLATEAWNKRIQQVSGEDGAYYNLGVAYEAVAQCKKAVEDYRKAVELRPDKELYGVVLSEAEKYCKPGSQK